MTKGWTGVVLLAFALHGIPVAAQAPCLPGQSNVDPIIDPLPSAQAAALAPASGLPLPSTDQSFPNSLPAGLANAWSSPPCPDPPVLYGSFGYMGMERQRLGHGAAAVLDTVYCSYDLAGVLLIEYDRRSKTSLWETYVGDLKKRDALSVQVLNIMDHPA